MPAAQARTGELDCADHLGNRIILTKHRHFEIALELAEQFLVVATDSLWRNPRDFGHHGLNIAGAQHFLSFAGRLQLLESTGFIDHVDGLVRQKTIGDIACRHF